MPIPGSGDYASAIGLYAAIVTALYHRERTGKGASVGTSLLARVCVGAGTFVAGGRSHGLHNPDAPTNPLINPYQSSDGRWFMLVASPPRWPGLAQAIGHPEWLKDPRFADGHAMAEHAAALTELLDASFRSQSLAHWRPVLDRAHITYHVALRVLLTGEPLPAAEANQHGLVTALTAPGAALNETRELAARMAGNAPLALAAVKEIVRAAQGLNDTDAFARQDPIVAGLIASADAHEGTQSFAEKRAPVWRGR